MAKMTITPAPFPTPSPPAPTPKRIRRLAKRLVFGCLGLFAILLIVFLLLPQWISNDQGRIYVLQQINKRSKATLAISNWSLGWFHGTELTDVALTLPEGAPLFTCPAIHSELTLWGILWGKYDVGTTTADNLHLNITRYADGSTSLDSLLTNDASGHNRLRESLRTLRGSLQAKNAVVTCTSVSGKQSIVYTDVKAAVTIASSDAPFHLQLVAIAPDRALSFEGTMPALSSWPLGHLDALIASSDFELSATQIPTALLCDFSDIDPRWEDSIGPTLSSIAVSNHSTASLDAGIFTALVHGSTAESFVDARLLLHPPTAHSPPLLALSGPASSYHLTGALKVSEPLAALLTHAHPIFKELASGTGPINIACSELVLPISNPQAASFAARLTFPTLTFRRASLITRLLTQPMDNPSISPTDQASNSPELIPVAAGPLRIRFDNARFSTESFIITLGRRQKITFRGSVALDGKIDMLATVPTADDTLGTGTADIPIAGTIDRPLLISPQ